MDLKYIILLTLILTSLLSFGSTGFNRITIDDGLSSNRTYDAVQDSEGFIWITTDIGIDRFDGKNFVHYELDMHDEFSGMGYQFNRILIDNDDNIFLVNNRHFIYKLNRNTDSFERIKSFEKLYGRYAFEALLDSHHNILIGTPSFILKYNYDTDSITKSPSNLNLTSAQSIIEFGQGYLVGMNNKLLKVSYDLNSAEELGSWSPKYAKKSKFNELVYDKKRNRIWIGTDNSGIFYFDLETNRYVEITTNKYLKNFPAWGIQIVNDSTLLIGSDGAGLFKLNTNSNDITAQYQFNQDDDSSIGSNVIHNILLTTDSLYFLTTDIGGVSIMNPHKPEFRIIKREKGNPNSLRNNVIYTIEELSPGIIVFGTDRGLSFWNRNTNTWSHPGNISTNSKNNVVTQIAKAKDGTFWASFFINKTRVFNASKKFKNTPLEVASIRNSKAMFFDDHTNTLWMDKNGRIPMLISYNFENHTTNRYTIRGVHSLALYEENKIIAGTTYGLYIIDTYTNDYTKFNKTTGKLNKITSVKVGADDKIWIGSDGGGIAQIDLKNEIVTPYTTKNGLASNHIYNIEIDNSGNIWAVSEQSLTKLQPQSGKVSNFTSSDGLVNIDYMHHASCKLQSGEIIFGGSDGATLFNPETISSPVDSGNLVLTSLYVNQKKITIANSNILTSPLNKTETLTLKHDDNSFSVEFTYINFTHPKQHRFSWILDGFDTSWSKPSRRGKATYSNLPPGEYLFRVKLISNNLNNKLAQEKVIAITINPPWWRTIWAFVLYTFIILIIILLALYYNKLMHDVSSTKEKLHYLANMAHEVKTPLSLIRAPIGDLIRQTEDETVAGKLKLAMENTEKLQKMIGQFLDFKKIDKKEYIHPERIDIISFVKRKIFAFDLVAKKNNLKLNFESALDSQIIYCAPDMLDRVISNLLSNAVKYNKPGGYINVRIIVEDEHWIIKVTDSGIGIPRKELNKVFKPFHRAENALQKNIPGSGVGLALVADIVKVLNGTINIKSKINQGTSFTLKFPVGEPDIHDVHEQQIDKTTTEDSQEDNLDNNNLFKVLIVEDNTELRKYIKKELSKQYQVIEASDGQEALTKVQKELPDLVLSDVAMPRMNGRQLCINIKTQPYTSHIPVLLLSGLDSKEHILKGIEAGADDYITKPFDSSILIAKIDNLINNRKKVKEMLLNPEKGSPDSEIKNDYDKQFVKKITTLIEENLSDPELSVRMLYSSAGMSRTAFYHKLKSLIDLSPAEFIRLIRLNKAKELLQNSKYNVNEVAYMCGFSDAKYFSTSFKKHFGNSPSTYLSNK